MKSVNFYDFLFFMISFLSVSSGSGNQILSGYSDPGSYTVEKTNFQTFSNVSPTKSNFSRS